MTRSLISLRAPYVRETRRLCRRESRTSGSAMGREGPLWTPPLLCVCSLTYR
jgi:hypothetical protein